MTTTEAVLFAFGGTTGLLCILGYLARSLLSQLLAKDLKKFELQLTQASAAAAEELKHRLTLVAHEHHVRFTRLHEKQAQVLEEIYAKLLEFEDASAAMSLADNNTPEQLVEFPLRMAEDAGRELAQYIRKNEIYLPSELSVQLHEIMNRINSLLGDCSFNLLSKMLANDGQAEIFPEAKESWASVHSYLEDKAPEVRKALESDFRKRLGTEAK